MFRKAYSLLSVIWMILIGVCVSGFCFSEAEHSTWDCPECGRQGNTGNFCGTCAHAAPWNETENTDNEENVSDNHFVWDCPECGRKGNTENYCANCGHPAPWKETEATDQDKYAVGNYVTFGTYPQTAAGTDKTPIEWLVLERDGQKALLLSRYGLDTKPYNNGWESVTWQTCTLRRWLNEDFYIRAFTATEQEGILETQVDNGSSQGYGGWATNGGNVTRDKIFLLSYTEANKYLGVEFGVYKNTKSRMSPTAYALQQGASTSSINKTDNGEAAGWWWLRSPGVDQDYNTADVIAAGSLNYRSVSSASGCIRPALWINLESGIF